MATILRKTNASESKYEGTLIKPVCVSGKCPGTLIWTERLQR
ncbi:hypothetical protein D1BOALGB6SA_8555 [Olavius sp. associated proteobacterium Delta 1]|nr:hypothetical protein D1BOALGB6SA_8555 [Olavius sp. associated proteobacterium Delta 1]